MRWIGLLAVLALAGFLVYLLVSADEREIEGDVGPPAPTNVTTGTAAPGAPLTRSTQCASCHPAVYAEWLGSHHEIAWKNPLVAQISDQFQNKICLDCHAPRPVLESGLGIRVLARSADREDGVNCLSCHDMGGGRLAGSTPEVTGPCNPVFDERLATVEHCAVCHNQHGTVDEWAQTDFAKQVPPVGCIDCHMAEVERRRADGTIVGGRNHTMHAAHDLEVIRRAPRVDVEVGESVVRIAVTNVGAAHNFPTDERARAVDLVVQVLDPQGNLVGEEKRDRYRNPYRDEVGLKNTQIAWNETRSYEFPLGTDRGTVHVRLLYKHTPFVPDEEGWVVFEKTIEFGPKEG